MPHIQFFFISLVCYRLFISSAHAAKDKADIVLYGAEIYTANPQQRTANTLAIKDGLFIFVGTKHGVKPYIGADTELINISGGQLLPGFIDNHNHVFEGDSEVGGLCELSPTQNMLGQTSHSMLVNSKVLALAGIDEQSEDPQGGIIMRDEQSGELNGVLFDNAGDLVS